MEPDYQTMATDLLNSGMGDSGRLRFILECITNEKPLYDTDKRFLETLSKTLELKIQRLQTSTQKASKQKTGAKTPREKATAGATTTKVGNVLDGTINLHREKATAGATTTKESKTTTVDTAVDRTSPKTTKQTADDGGATTTSTTKDAQSRALISDEYLDKHIDQINEKRNPNRVPEEPIRKRKKSFFERLFSK